LVPWKEVVISEFKAIFEKVSDVFDMFFLSNWHVEFGSVVVSIYIDWCQDDLERMIVVIVEFV
jgi:hypothetical protein